MAPMTEPTTTRDPSETIGNIRRFLVAAEALPSPKGTALRFAELARDPGARMEDMTQVIRSDPALSGFVLRAANAACFAGSTPMLDLNRAMVRLGVNAVRSHALALSLIRDGTRVRCARFDYNAFWTTSLLIASLMEALARRDGAFPAPDAFVLGLLSRIGRLAFATAAPTDYAGVLERHAAGSVTLEVLEQRAFGFDHHELSSVLLADWGIPTALADVVYWQCDPEGGGFTPESRPYRLAGALQLASSLADGCLAPEENQQDAATVYLRAAVLEVPAEELNALTEASLANLRDWLRLVGLPVPATSALSL
jgi:HD-like signal output (HDOD) protein